MKKTFKNIFKICIYLFAVWGFVLTVVFFAMKLGLTKSNSLIDSQSDYFKKLTIDSKNGDDDFVVGEPLYQNSNQKAPVNSYPYPPLNNNNKNPYYGKLEPIKPYANNPTPNNTNPYYQVPQAGQYFGDWNHKK